MPDSTTRNPRAIDLESSSANGDAGLREKVYVQASEWVRLANTIIWVLGGLVFPVCAGALGLGIRDRDSVRPKPP